MPTVGFGCPGKFGGVLGLGLQSQLFLPSLLTPTHTPVSPAPFQVSPLSWMLGGFKEKLPVYLENLQKHLCSTQSAQIAHQAQLCPAQVSITLGPTGTAI